MFTEQNEREDKVTPTNNFTGACLPLTLMHRMIGIFSTSTAMM